MSNHFQEAVYYLPDDTLFGGTLDAAVERLRLQRKMLNRDSNAREAFMNVTCSGIVLRLQAYADNVLREPFQHRGGDQSKYLRELDRRQQTYGHARHMQRVFMQYPVLSVVEMLMRVDEENFGRGAFERFALEVQEGGD